MTLEQQIEQLKKDLTGNLMHDIDTQGKIYELKKEIAAQEGITVDIYDSNNNEQCDSCGS